MIVFFVTAALLLGIALFFVVPPLIGKRSSSGNVSHDATNLSIYRDQLRELDADLASGTLDKSQYETAKLEIERRVLEEVEQDAEQVAKTGGPQWTLAVAVAVMIPLVTIPLYIFLGTPEALDSSTRTASSQGGHELTPERIAGMSAQLKERLRANPEDPEGWGMLAKTSQAIGRYDDAVVAYRELIKRVPPDAQLYADFADTLAMANGRTLVGEPSRLIEQALAIDPNNVKALALGGTAAYQNQDYASAVGLWRRILAVVPPDEDFHQRIKQSVIEAESKITGKSVAAEKSSAAPTGGKVTGKVSVDSAVAKSVSPEDVVFVYARAATGPKMPLAIKRLQVKDLPVRFELNDAMAMAPGMSISKFGDLVIGARVSRTGNAVAQPGDWESELIPAKVGSDGVALVISRIVR